MDKGDFIKELKEYKKDISDVEKACEKVTGKQIQTKSLLDRLETLATKWFEHLEPILRSTFQLEEEVITNYREPFGKLLELSGGKPSKKVVLTILGAIIRSYHVDILVPVQKHQAILSRFSSLDTILSHAVGLEIDYLTEAIECAQLGKRRAAIILGWCAAVNRLHMYIEQIGFTKFNQASVQMSNIQSGRYKRFNKKFDIQNLSDLRMSVFDNDLLWVLEFLGAIDGNQHERLEICFVMRNTCAHPGETNITPENLLSFFSDIDSLIFNSSKFTLPST
jgi:hypothetical protein